MRSTAPVTEHMVEYAGARALAKRYEPHLELACHSHPYAALVLVLDGLFEERCNGSVDVRRPGTLRVLPAGEKHADRYSAYGAQCFLIQLPPDLERAWTGRSASLLTLAHLEPASRPATIVMEMHREFRAGDALAPLALHGLTLELLAELGRGARIERRVPPWLRRARVRLEEEFRDGINLATLARESGVHPSHFSRTFRRHLGCSPFEYVTRLRVAWAKRELASAERSLAGIAADVGFSDQASFTRRFRQLTGCTPGSYRASMIRAAD